MLLSQVGKTAVKVHTCCSETCKLTGVSDRKSSVDALKFCLTCAVRALMVAMTRIPHAERENHLWHSRRL